MRNELQKIGEEQRHTFSGRFERYGVKSGYKGPVTTVLLLDIRDESGNQVTDHLWFNLTKGFEALELNEGDGVQFCARVKPYVKGYMGRRADVYCPVRIDYKLSHPTKVKKMTANHWE